MKLLKITDEIINYQFIPVPNKLLHTEEYFKISSNAKLVYILFVERLSLSKQNKLIYKEKSGIGKVDRYYICDIFQNNKQVKITNDNRKIF